MPTAHYRVMREEFEDLYEDRDLHQSHFTDFPCTLDALIACAAIVNADNDPKFDTFIDSGDLYVDLNVSYAEFDKIKHLLLDA